MNYAYLLAYPAGHSLSPVMHNAAFAHLGIEARYALLESSPHTLREAVATLRQPHVLGANISIPHKEKVIPLLDSLSDAAKQIGAVNTICNRQGELYGDNTDAAGFLAALQECASNWDNQNVFLLGAGGAARAVLYALKQLPFRRIYLHNRTLAKAEQLARHFTGITVVEDKNVARECALIVNTTSLGMHGEAEERTALESSLLPSKGVVCDIIYRPAETLLLRHAKQRGLRVQNGLAMLLHQGALAFELWTGARAPRAIMRQALVQALH